MLNLKILCPKCNSSTYRWGHDTNYRYLQRYRCRNNKCRHQFTPDKPKKPKKQAKFKCPKCGACMSVYKRLSDGIRLRCERHNHRSKIKCAHKINIPLPGKTFKIAKDPIKCIQTALQVKFSYNKMRFSKDLISVVLYFAVFKSLPATEVSSIMKELFRVNISGDTVTRWTHKAALNIHKNLGLLSSPSARGRRRTLTDETVFKVRGQKRWVWMTKESRFDSE